MRAVLNGAPAEVQIALEDASPKPIVVLRFLVDGSLNQANAKRTALAPELPTIAESGLAGFDISTWFGIFVPAGTPKAAVDRLYDEFAKALNAPDVREKMIALGAEPVASRPEDFAAYVKAEAAKYAKLVKASGAKVD